MPVTPKRKPRYTKRGAARHLAPDPLAGVLLARYITAHCEWLEVKGYSTQTTRSRRIALRSFAVWANERGLTDPREITKPILERYQRHLFYYRKKDGDPLTIASQLTLLHAVRHLFKWLTRQNHILYNPASELELPRRSRQLPRYILTVQEVESMMNQTDCTTIEGLRDRALLELLYSTGLRRMEAAALSCYDIDLIQGVLLVRHGKGRRDRWVPIGERACQWIKKYLTEARPQFVAQDATALFVSDYGNVATAGFVADRVRRCLDAAGIEKPGAAHLLRHACATHMLEGGADIRFIQALLGHEDLTYTQIYTRVSIEKLKAVHAAAHPARLTRTRSDEPNADEEEHPPAQEKAKEALLEALVNEED
jgi:integrase/recombinase XerD